MTSVPLVNFLQKKRSLVLITAFFLSLACYSQLPAEQTKRLSPILKQQLSSLRHSEKKLFTVFVSDKKTFKAYIEKNDHIKIIYEYDAAPVFILTASWDEISKTVLPFSGVVFIDEQRI